MDGNKLLLVLVLLGITVWNIPNTTSIFQGQHTFYNGSAPCQKCHQDIQITLDFNNTPTAHRDLGCQGCHTRDGNTSHSASIRSCSDCHKPLNHNSNYTNCVLCHGSNAYKDANIEHRSGNLNITCSDCHNIT